MGAARRLLSLWLGLWFVFVVAEPVPIHDCPMHNPLLQMHSGQHSAASGNQKTASASHASAAHEGHDTGHHGPQTEHPSGHSSHSSQEGSHYCLCLGCAAGSAPANGAKVANLVPVPAKIARLQAVYPAVERLALAPEFILPPSTAPPTLS